MSLSVSEIAAVRIAVRVLHEGVPVEEVFLEVSRILVAVLESEDACSHLRVLELSVKLLAVAEREDALAMDLIVFELALVSVACGFVNKFPLAVLAIQTELALVPSPIEKIVEHALAVPDPVFRFYIFLLFLNQDFALVLYFFVLEFNLF